MKKRGQKPELEKLIEHSGGCSKTCRTKVESHYWNVKSHEEKLEIVKRETKTLKMK